MQNLASNSHSKWSGSLLVRLLVAASLTITAFCFSCSSCLSVHVFVAFPSVPLSQHWNCYKFPLLCYSVIIAVVDFAAAPNKGLISPFDSLTTQLHGGKNKVSCSPISGWAGKPNLAKAKRSTARHRRAELRSGRARTKLHPPGEDAPATASLGRVSESHGVRYPRLRHPILQWTTQNANSRGVHDATLPTCLNARNTQFFGSLGLGRLASLIA